MATTFYSTAEDNFRCRCDYTVTSTDTTLKVSGTIYLQHKGAQDSHILLSIKAGVGLGEYVSVFTDSVSSVAKHTDWTNIKSKKFSFTETKQHDADTRYLCIGSGIMGSDGEVKRTISIPKKTSYAITYDANGGNWAPANDEKWYNETAYISVYTPYRFRYAFKCWNTKADGSGTNYNPGQSYTTNAPLTLYAQWYAIPVITSVSAIRCNAQGEDDPYGEYALVTCQWSIASGTATLTGKITPQDGTATAFTFSSGSTGTGGVATALISSTNGLRIDEDTQYIIEVTATNNAYSTAKTSVNEILTRAFYVMDWKAGGLGVGIGRAAPDTGLEIGYKATFDDDVYFLENTFLSLDATDPPDTSTVDGKIFKALQDLDWTDVIV